MNCSHSAEYMTANLDKLVTNVVKLLLSKSITIASAESCTGGLISELITSVSGDSEIFELGLCTYSERMKTAMLGVSENTIKNYGVVSEQTALEMVKGLKKCSGADVCVSVTGIAGPGGGTKKTPVGTVYIGFDILGRQFVMLPDMSSLSDKSRTGIRRAAAAFAFGVIEKEILEVKQTDE